MQDQLKFTSVLIDIIPYPIFYKGADSLGLKMFFIDRLKKEYSKDEEGHVPNSTLFQIFT
jgi:hypothetical protein